jgi:hypothetical protein
MRIRVMPRKLNTAWIDSVCLVEKLKLNLHVVTVKLLEKWELVIEIVRPSQAVVMAIVVIIGMTTIVDVVEVEARRHVKEELIDVIVDVARVASHPIVEVSRERLDLTRKIAPLVLEITMHVLSRENAREHVTDLCPEIEDHLEDRQKMTIWAEVQVQIE